MKRNIPGNFFEMWRKVDEERKKKLGEKMDLRLLRALAKVWLNNLEKSSERLRMKEGNEVNTFATVIRGYEGYHWQHDLFSKLAESIKATENANIDRKPGYLVIPAHPGKGKTRTVGEIVKSAMDNSLKVLLKDHEQEVNFEKVDHSFALMITFNERMRDSLMVNKLFQEFREIIADKKEIAEIDLVARFAFW